MIKCSCNSGCGIALSIDDHAIEMTNRYGRQYNQRLELNEENVKQLILELQKELNLIKKETNK